MERMNPDTRLISLRRANEQLASFFARYANAPVVGTSEEVEALVQVERTLKSVRALLKTGFQHTTDDEARKELAVYRGNLIRLRHELAILQDSAIGCRARLFARHEHLHAAQAWCAASRDTQ
jgi:hypothetical protein